MSIVYRKVNVQRISDGQTVAQGILLMDNASHVWYATREHGVQLTLNHELPITLVGAGFVREGNHDRSAIGFVSIVRCFSEIFPGFEGYRAHLSEERAIMLVDGNTLDLNEVFADDHNEAPAAQQEQSTIQAAAAPSNPDAEIAIKSGYTRAETYTGFSGYHSNQRSHRFNTPVVADKPWRVGVELEVYAKTDEARQTIVGARSNWFQCESDSSLHDSAFGGQARAIELKTIPLKACDAKNPDFWDAPMAKLKALAKSKGSSTTGLHVHIGKEILGNTEAERTKTLTKLIMFYVYHIEDVADAHQKNTKMCGREQGYGGYTLAEAKDADVTKLRDWGALAHVNEQGQREVGDKLIQKCRGQRWDINIGNLNTYGTIEFRKGKGSISKVRIAGLVAWWEQMVLYCKNTPWNELNFNDFFSRITSEYPCVAHWFNEDEEA